MKTPGRDTGHRDSFARSDLRHVALGEGCNCAVAMLRLRHGAWPAPESLRGVLASLGRRLRIRRRAIRPERG